MMRAAGIAMTACVLALAACGGPPSASDRVDLTLENQPTMELQVGRVEVVNAYIAPRRAPNVEHIHTRTPAELVAHWSETRLRPVSSSGIATVTVLDGSVTEKALPLSKGILGPFKVEPEFELAARLEVELTIRRDASLNWSTRVTSEVRQTVLENASLNDRDAAYLSLLEELISQFIARANSDLMSAGLARAAPI